MQAADSKGETEGTWALTVQDGHLSSLCNLEKTGPRVLWLTSEVSKKWLNPSSKIVGLIKESGFNKVDNEKVEDLIASHNEVLTAKELSPGSFVNAHP